jgi:type II secretory pathway pseudopilin PulG
MSARRGFTVLEAAVALLIIGVASIGVLQALGAQTRTAALAKEQLELAAVAQDVVARIRVLPAYALASLPDSLARGGGASVFTGVEWQASVRPVPAERDLYEIGVEVTRGTAMFELRTLRYAPVVTSPVVR